MDTRNLVILKQKGNVLKDGFGPQVVACLGEMNPVRQKKSSLDGLEFCEQVEKTAAGLEREGLHGTIELLYSLLVDPGDMQGEKAVDDDLCRWVVLAQENDKLLQGIYIAIIFHEKIISADHDEDDLGISSFFLYQGHFIQEALRGLAAGAQILDFKMSDARLPVEIGNQRIPEKK
jgi:hypothetical protein